MNNGNCLLVLSLSICYNPCQAGWKELKTVQKVDTNQPDVIATALSQYFPDLQHFLSAEEMVTPGDIQVISLHGQVREYRWNAPEGCKSGAGIPTTIFSDVNASYVKKGQTWHVAILPNLSSQSCNPVSVPGFFIKKLRLK